MWMGFRISVVWCIIHVHAFQRLVWLMVNLTWLEGEKLLACLVVLALIILSLLLESSSNFFVLVLYSAWRIGRLQLIIFSAEWIMHCSLALSHLEADLGEVKMDLMAVQNWSILDCGMLCIISNLRNWILLLYIQWWWCWAAIGSPERLLSQGILRIYKWWQLGPVWIWVGHMGICPEVHHHINTFLGVELSDVITGPLYQLLNILFVWWLIADLSSIMVVTSANLMSFTEGFPDVQSFVYRVEKKRMRTALWSSSPDGLCFWSVLFVRK